jgi:hypothetical protein
MRPYSQRWIDGFYSWKKGEEADVKYTLSDLTSDQASPDNKKARVFNSVLALAGLEYGVA